MTNSTPLVSVILPVYNSEKFIRRAIDSVLSQSYKFYEIIIIDDGSTDSTYDIIKEYDNNIVYCYQNNSGASAARNLGVKKSSGEVIAFIDSDDMWHPEKLTIQVAAYLKNPTAALIHSGYIKEVEFNGFNKINVNSIKLIESDFNTIFKTPYLQTPSVMIPKKMINDLGVFDVELPTAEDVDFFLRYSYQNKVIYIPDALIFVSINQGSLCDDLRSYLDNIKVIDDFVSKHPEFLATNKKLVSKVKSNVYGDYADELCFKNYCLEAIQASYQSLKYSLNIKSINLLLKSFLKLLIGRGRSQ